MEIISKSCYHKEFINGTRNGSKTWLSTLGDNNLLLLHSPAGMEVSAIHLMSCEVIPRKIRPVENRKLSPIISTHDMSINRGTKQSNYLSFTSATMEDIMSTSSRYENIILTEVLPLQKSSVDNCYVCIFPIAKIIKAKLGPRDDLMKPHAGILKVVFANGMEIALQVDFSSKTPLILASVVSRRDTKNLNYLYTTYQVMFLTLLDMHRSRLLDVSTLIWTHSALCSFSSSMIPKYDSQVLIKLLKNVGRLWSNQAVSHLLTLAAVGHIIACFGPTQKEYLSDKSDQNYDLNSDLWMLCNDVLKSLPSHRLSGEDVKLIESFPVRVALSFLVYLDRTSMIESYTYESFSSVLPLQVHFKLVEVYKLKMLSYATPPPLHTTLSSKVTKTCELISVLAKSDTKMANEFIGLHEKALLVTSTCHSMFDTLAGEVESVKDTCKIWLATKSMLEGRGKISRDDMLRHLSTIVQTPYEFLVSTFDEAFRVWSLYLQLVPYFNKLPANTTLVTGTNKKLIDVANNLELFEKNIEFIQSEFALLHQQQEAMLLFLTNYATSHQASHCKESILQNLPCKISLNEMEFLFHRNKVASFPVEYTFDSFLSIYTDEPFRGSYGFETFVSTLVPLPAPVYEGNDQPVVNNSDVHAVVVIDSHMVRVVNKSIGSVKQVVAGGSVSGCALGPRSLTQLNGPKGFCLIPAACENTMLGLIADTGNHCIRGVILNDRGVFQEEMFSVAGLSRQSGHINGTAGSALFNNPSGMAVVDMMSVLICDYGNHTLRLLRREEVNSNHWVVSTVAGQSTIAGNIDGIADTTALLQLPYQIVTAPTMNQDMEEPYKNFYFTEHGPVHSVRCYRHYPSQPHLSEVITLHKSEPFINLQGLCVDAHGDILVCDSGAGCIWSIDVNTKALTKKITSEFMFEASTALLEKRHIGELKPCTRFMPTTITHMSHVQPGYYLITSQDSPHMLFKYFDTELTSSFRNSLMPLHSEICDGKVTLAQHASTFIQNTSSATNAVSSLVSLVDNVRRSVREALFRRQIILVQNMQVSFANINPSPFNSFFFVCMLANAPDMESLAGLICKLFEETKQSHGRRGGHMGMTGRQRAQAYGLKDDERVGMTNYDDAFDDYDDQPRLGFSGSSGDSDELKGRLIEIMESYNFATLHLDSVMVLQSLFNITKVIGVEKAGNMFQAVLRNQSFTFNVSSQIVEILTACFGRQFEADDHHSTFDDDNRDRDRQLAKNSAFKTKLKEPVQTWLTRIIPLPDINNLNDSTFQDFLLSKVYDWMQIWTQILTESEHADVAEISEIFDRDHLLGLGTELFDEESETMASASGRYADRGHMKRSRTHTPPHLKKASDIKVQSKRQELLKSMHQTWNWLATTYFESLCKDDVAVGQEVVWNESLGEYKYKDKLFNKKEAFFQAIPYLCSHFNDNIPLNLIVSIGSSLSRKYLGAETSMKLLISHVYSSTAVTSSLASSKGHADLMVADNDTSTQIPGNLYSTAQGILADLVGDAFAELLNRKTSDVVNTEEVFVPRKVQVLTPWQICLRIVSNNPLLWSLVVDWINNGNFTQFHVSGPALGKIRQVANKIMSMAYSLSESVMRGHIDLDFLRLLVRTHTDLHSLWGYVNSPLIDISFLQNLLDEMLLCQQNASNLATVILPALVPTCQERSVLNTLLLTWNTQLIATTRELFRHQQHERYLVPTQLEVPTSSATTSLETQMTVEKLRELVLIRPLPDILCNGAEYLSLSVSSEMFIQFWEDNATAKTLNDISVVIGKWAMFLTSVMDGSVTVSTLSKYANCLAKPNELNIFVRTGMCITRLLQTNRKQNLSMIRLNVLPESDLSDNQILFNVQDSIQKFDKLHGFYTNRQNVNFVISASRQMVVSSERHFISNQDSYLKSLCSSIDTFGSWESHTLNQVLQYYPQVKLLDSRLLQISYELLLAIQSKNEFITWLCSVSDDDIFSSSIEIARSLQEINAPVELWDPLSGRVGERFLSMISNVRTYLHPFLYDYDPSSATFESFVQLFSGLNAKTDPMQIVNNMSACNDVRVGLSKIIGTKVDTSGTSRLMHLYSREASSTWRCGLSLVSTDSKGSDSIISLRYKGSVEDDSAWRSHSFNDLMEFQNNIVLDRAIVHTIDSSSSGGGVKNNNMDSASMADDDNNTSVERATVDMFLVQFNLIRKVKDLISSLYSSGHFKYTSDFVLEMTVDQSEQNFKNQVRTLETEKREWDTHVALTRQKYYFINYFDIRRCLKLVSLLETASTINAAITVDSDIVSNLKKYVCFINPQVSSDVNMLTLVTSTLVLSWMNSRGVHVDDDMNESHSSFSQLTRLAQSLDESLRILPQRVRPLILPDIDRYVVSERFRSGIYVASGQSLKVQYDQLFTICAIQQRFPEWESCVVCSKSTSFEQISLLLHRWFRAGTYRELGSVFFLVEVEKLSFDVQFATVQLLTELSNLPSATDIDPLFLISNANESCYLTTQYISHRVNNGILPAEVLSSVAQLLCNYGAGVSCHTSRLAGAGKSFDIRLNASQNSLLYTHIPINSATVSTGGLVHLINENILRCFTEKHLSNHSTKHELMDTDMSSQQLDKVLLHFDLSSTCNSSLVSVLFSLCTLNTLADSSTDSVFSFHPLNTKVCVELAAGLHYGSLSQLTFYPTTDYSVSVGTFIFDLATLRQGMGEEFHAHLYGSVVDHGDTAVVQSESNSSHNLTQATAYDRLFYVLEALHSLDKLSGAFPHDFDSEMLAVHSEEGFAISVPTEQAFQLLISASGLHSCPSLWCVWNFINVMYWQLQEMHHTSSPLYLACMPDSAIQLMTVEFDTAMKNRVKGEMINFMIKTAREFATRQTSTKENFEPNRVVGVLVKDLSFVAESKLKDVQMTFWKRERFDNDSHPVFKSPTFYHNFALGNAAGRTPDKAYRYYIHFRESENRWVIDDTVQYTGGVIAYSQNNSPLPDTVFELRNLKGRSVSVEIRKGTKTLPNRTTVDTVIVSGFENAPSGLGAVAGANDNGTYVRLVGHDINDKAHYFKEGAESRHLYFILEGKNRWVIAKTCNAEVMGACAYSPNDRMESSTYIIYPPNSIERNASFTLVTAANAVEVLTKELQAQAPALAQNVNVRSLYDYSFVPSTDATTRVVDMSTDAIAADLENAGLSLDIITWRDSNHECVFFNNQTGSVNFLSTDSNLLRRNIHPVLLKHLQSNHIVVGEDLQNLEDTSKYWDVLANVTGVRRSQEEVNTIFDNSFCLTGDTLLKTLAIVFRLRCKIPVVLLGECGCGKTMLLGFLCKWLGAQLLSLDVHGGTKESDIIGVFEKAEYNLVFNSKPDASVIVFLDEVNTCAHMGLLNEIICHRSIYGRRLKDGIQVLAALNPYRTRPIRQEAGLTFSLGTNPLEDPMNKLVYRVHPIPATLKDFIFDFGSLESATELLYIKSMVTGNERIRSILKAVAALKPAPTGTIVANKDDLQVKEDENTFSLLISAAQNFVREAEGDPSVVSLRDVKRVLLLFLWFHKEWMDKQLNDEAAILKLVPRCIILALAHVYCYRLPTEVQRLALWDKLSELLRNQRWIKGSHHLFRPLATDNIQETIIDKAQNALVSHLEVEEGISMNQALTENLFVSIIAILNKIPIFIVGKPGTSKTLALQVIQNNLQGRQSPREYWRDKPSVHIFQYQCSPLSTSHSIKYIFEAARSFQEHSSDVLTVLLLDEVGLAENSPDLPLKVLHYMLVDPPVAIIGLSNWTLDSSKMNRAICLQRPELSEADIIRTGYSIISNSVLDSNPVASATAMETDETALKTTKKPTRGRKPAASKSKEVSTPISVPVPVVTSFASAEQAHPWVKPLGRAFWRIYNHQNEMLEISRDFIGMRDYYCMLKQLRTEITTKEFSPQMLTSVICRNFSGHPKSISQFLPIFYNACFPQEGSRAQAKHDSAMIIDGEQLLSSSAGMNLDEIPESIPSAIQLVSENVTSQISRNLMILSKNDSVLSLLFGCGILNDQSDIVLIGSRFRDDLEEIHLIQQINKVKQAMAEGKVAVLLNNDSIYESLYDVLNQRYVTQRDFDTGTERRMLRLAMGSRSQLCPVKNGFKLIVVVNQAHAYEKLDLPLLNRFEKQIISPEVALQSTKARRVLRSLEEWCASVMEETRMDKLSTIFCGLYADTLSSLILSLTGFGKQSEDSWTEDEVLKAAQNALLRIAVPASVLYSRQLQEFIREDVKNNQLTSVDPFEAYMTSKSNIFTHLEEELRLSQGYEKLLLIATKSPVNQFEANFHNTHSVSSQTLHQFRLIFFQLAHVTAERNLTSRIDSFYEDISFHAPTILAILCDPLYCHESIIAHARYLAAKAFRSRQEDYQRRGVTAPAVAKHVLFVVHLPQGVSSRVREFSLDFYSPWSYSFLDDLSLQSTTQQGPNLMQLLRLSLFNLCDQGIFNLRAMMIRNFQSALAQCHQLTLDKATLESQYVPYVKILFELLKLSPFVDHLYECLLHCLRTLRPINNIEFQVYRACENLEGSLKQSIEASIENIVTNGLGHVLRQLDGNFRISTLYRSVLPDGVSVQTETLDLWLRISRILHPPESIARLCPADLSIPAPSDALVFNSSLHGAYIARFAFSDRILAFLNEPLREALEQKFGLDFFSLQRSLHAMIEAVVGPELYLIIARISSNNLSYLYDFVISSVPPQQYVRFEDQYSYVKVVMECMGHPAGFADSPIEYSPDVVHAKYWCAEGGMRFFYTFSAWSSIRSGQHMYGHSLFLPDNFELSIIEFVAESLSNLRMSVCETSLHMTNRLREVDLTVIQQMLLLFLNSLDKILQLPSDQQRPLLSTWTRVFSLVRTDFEALLALAVESNLSGQIQYKILQQWWLLSLVRAVCTEMVDQPEFDASLFTQLHTQMHTVIDPTRPESLDSFIAFSDTHSRHRSQLIKCYLRKFLLPESQFLQRLGSTASLSQQLVRRVGSLLIVQDGKMVDDATDADESIEIEETALLRTATDIVCKYAAVGDVKEILCDLFKTGSTTTFRVAQLYMERNENDLYNSQGNLVMDTSVSALIRSMVNVKSTAELHSLLATHPTDILSQLVYVKSAVSEYAYTVSTFILNLLSTTTTDIISAVQKASLPVCPLPDILGPKGLLPAQVYFFTQLLHKGGKKALLLYLRFKKAPVLLPGITLISPTEPMLQTIDPFSGLTGGELYYPACSLILQLKYQHGVEKLKSWYKENATIVSKLSDRLNILIAALFTQLTSQKTLVSKSYLKQLVAFFQEDIAESSPECVDYHLYLDVLSHFWSAASDKTTHNATIQTNLKLHILLLALSPKSGWLRTLFQNPKAFVKGYLPSMIDDEFAIFKTVTDAKGDIVNEVGWYECSNGHKYSVGNCMRPMEVATCPSCGVSIGGRDHTSVAGVRNLANDSNFGQSLKGYSLDSTATPQGYNIVRLGKLTTVILRFIIHTVMLCASEIYPKIETKKAADSGIGGGAQSTVVELMYPDSTADSVTIDRVKVELNVRLTADWKEIETLLDMEEENLAMGFHMVIKAMMGREVSYSDDGSNFGRSQSDYDYAMMLGGQAVHRQRTKFNMPPENMSPQLRAVFEQKLEIDIVNKIFASPTSKRQIRDEKARFQSDNVDVQLTRNLNEWSVQVLESDIPEDPLQYTTASLWRVRQVVTFNEFCRCFRLVSANEKSFPVLAAILQYEKSLSLVKLATHILAWHALLFKVFQPGSLTRSDASALTNKDVIALLPENERNHAELVMNNFCDAFNAVITQPGNLRECAENVFIDTSTGQIDLDMTRGASGSFKSMGPDASLSFSLPSSLKDGNEFVDPRALCTLFILDKLKNIQETVVEALLTATNDSSSSNSGSGSFEVVSQKASQKRLSGNDATGSGLPLSSQQSAHKIPLTSYLTPVALISRRLLSYDRDTHLMPSIYAYYKQSLEPCRGELSGFDFKSIESDLRDALLPSAQPFAVAAIEFSFRGETSVSGAASRLGQLITQVELPSSILDQIWTEVDTEDRLTRVLAQLEDCVAFISSSGGTGVQLSGDTKLSSFVLDVLMVDDQKWLGLSTPAINASVQLKHIKSLSAGLHERRMDGNIFKDLSEKFKKPLSEIHKKSLLACLQAAGSQASLLTKTLHSFLIKLMQSGLSFDAYLYYNLLYVDDSVLDECSWYENHFPKDLSIECTWEVYKFVETIDISKV